jgi:hypothetical protein
MGSASRDGVRLPSYLSGGAPHGDDDDDGRGDIPFCAAGIDSSPGVATGSTELLLLSLLLPSAALAGSNGRPPCSDGGGGGGVRDGECRRY